MQCPLCGYEFDASTMACHGNCPMSQRCVLICCPNCGYQLPDEEKTSLAAWLRRLLHRRPSTTGPTPAPTGADGQSRMLLDLPAGATAQVVAIRSARPARLERLSLLGIAPGSHIRLEQRWPAVVVRVGETELSLDEDVAGQILVSPLPSA